MDEAPPPPLQMAATPFCPGLRAWTRCRTMRAPDILQLNHNFDWNDLQTQYHSFSFTKTKATTSSDLLLWHNSPNLGLDHLQYAPIHHIVFQPLMLRIYVSCSMLSSHLTRSLPLFLTPSDFVKVKFPAGTNVFWYQQCPNHLTLPSFTTSTVSGSLYHITDTVPAYT